MRLAKKIRRLIRACNRRRIHYTKRLIWYMDVLSMYALVTVFQRGKILRTAERAGIRCVKFKAFHFRTWHNHTGLFRVFDDKGNSYFLKASKRIRAISAEAASVEFIKAHQADIPLKVIDILCRFYNDKWGFFIQPFVSGSTLKDMIERDQLSEEKAYELIDTLRTTVRQFQQLSFVSSDFLPQNIIVDANGEMYLIDFEFAHVPGVTLAPIQLRENQIKFIGTEYGMGIGVADDAYSLCFIAEKLLPGLVFRDYDLWLELNKGIGICQVDLSRDKLIEGSDLNKTNSLLQAEI